MRLNFLFPCFLVPVLAALPKSLQGKAKSDLQAIWMAPTRKGAEQAFARLLRLRGRALGTLAHHQPDRAHARRRTKRTKHCVSRSTFLGLAFKLAEEAAKSWPRIRAPQTLAELLAGTRYEDAIPVTDDPPEQQREAA